MAKQATKLTQPNRKGSPAAPRPPGPKGNFLLGNLREYRRDPLGFLAQCARDYGDVVYLRLADYRLFLLNHPDYVEEVLVTQNTNFIKDKFLRMRTSRRLFGNGLLTSEGDFWRRQRRLAQPNFHRERIAGYGAVMVTYAERRLSHWRDGEVLDISREMMRLTLEIVAKTLFNAEVTGEAADVGAAMEVLSDQFTTEGSLLDLISNFLPTPRTLRFERAVRRLENIIYRIIRERRASGAEAGDLLSLLLQAQDVDGSRMTDQQLRDEALTIFLAGHDTTALTLAWTLFLLAQHPAIVTELETELSTVLAGRAPTVADLPQLRYTEMVIKEGMRLYPPAWGLGRESLSECEIGGYVVPKGCQVIFCPWLLQRDERYFEQPAEFQPERWSSDLAKRLPKYAYFPFGGGPRLCIGNSFAMMEAILILATMAQQFRFRLVSSAAVELLPSITLRPKQPIKMVVTRR